MRAPREPKDASSSIRIIDQIWTPTVREFVLALDEQRLVLSFEQNSDASSGWKVVVRGRQHRGADALFVSSTAHTRSTALHAAGRAWDDATKEQGFIGMIPIDWGAVERALEGVRAL